MAEPLVTDAIYKAVIAIDKINIFDIVINNINTCIDSGTDETIMNLSSDQLAAFLEVHKQGSFSAGARSLGLTQSATSQKIARLEELLQSPLFIRLQAGLELTSAGVELLAFARAQLSHEESFLSRYNQYRQKSKLASKEELAGVFRLASFSSVNRSVLIPLLAPLLRQHPSAHIEFSSHEMKELLPLLERNAKDGVVVDFVPNRPGIEHILLGHEEYVVVEARQGAGPSDRYLDHGPEDNATDSYLRHQDYKKPWQREFMGDVYSILEGVALGLGRAVMSRHLVEKDRRFKIIKFPKRYLRPVHFCFLRQHYYAPLQQKILSEIQREGRKFLP